MLKIIIRIWKNTPMLGDHVSITTIFSYDKHWNGRFLGFDDEYVWLKIDGDQTPSRFYFTGIYAILRSDGELVQRMHMREGLFRSGWRYRWGTENSHVRFP